MRQHIIVHGLALSLAGLVACGPSGPSARHFRGGELGGLSNSVLSVAVGPQGGVWIGTSNGVVRKKGGDLKTWWKSWRVTAAAAGAVNTGYFGVQLLTKSVNTGKMMNEARLYKLQDRGDNLREIPLGEPMLDERIDALLLDKAGRLWVAARERGVMMMEKGSEEPKVMVNPGLMEGASPTSLAEGPDGAIYVGTFGGGIAVLKDGKVAQTFSPKNSGLRGNGVVRSVAFHPVLGLFAATAEKVPGPTVIGGDARTLGTGVSRLVNGQWQSITAGPGVLKSNDVLKVAISPEGNVWFLTRDQGLSVLRAGAWVQPPAASNLAVDIAFHGGGAWVATGDGLSSVSL